MHHSIIPKRTFTFIASIIAPWHGGPITSWIIRTFIKKYNVDMNEAVYPEVTHYKTFNEFFTRALRPEVRPFASTEQICPVDGKVSQLGKINNNQLIQAKGSYYSTQALLAGDKAFADKFTDGSFATLYLSPKDYHRIHMPSDGKLERMIYVPGDHYPVKPEVVRDVQGLFARNERVICEFSSDKGNFVMVLVGATIVASIETVWHGIVNKDHQRRIREWTYQDKDIVLKKGQEMGRFLLGSTVIMLYPKDVCTFTPNWVEDTPVKLGEAMSNI